MRPGSTGNGVAAGAMLRLLAAPLPTRYKGWASVGVDGLERSELHRRALSVKRGAAHRVAHRFDAQRVLARFAIGEVERHALVDGAVWTPCAMIAPALSIARMRTLSVFEAW